MILLCACFSHEHCHRLPVSERLAESVGVEVIHLGSGDFAEPGPTEPTDTQLRLF